MRSSVNKKGTTFILVILLLFFLGVGFAYLSQALVINGTTAVKKTTWDVHFENIVVKEGSVGDTLPTIGNDRLCISLSLMLSNPNDFYEYYVDVVNNGSIDAKVEEIVIPSFTAEQQKSLQYTITYIDGVEIKNNDLLKAGEKDTIRVRIEYKDVDNASDLLDTSATIDFDSKIDYMQDDGTGIERIKNS